MRRTNKLGKPPSRRPDPPTSLAAAARQMTGVTEGCVLVVGSRVGTAEHVPPGYQPSPCMWCKQMVWVDGSMLLTFDVVAVCTDCVPV